MSPTDIARLEASLLRMEEKFDKAMVQIAAQFADMAKIINKHEVSIARNNIWFGVLGFLATIVVPSFWYIVISSIVNDQVLISLLELIHFS